MYAIGYMFPVVFCCVERPNVNTKTVAKGGRFPDMQTFAEKMLSFYFVQIVRSRENNKKLWKDNCGCLIDFLS